MQRQQRRFRLYYDLSKDRQAFYYSTLGSINIEIFLNFRYNPLKGWVHHQQIKSSRSYVFLFKYDFFMNFFPIGKFVG